MALVCACQCSIKHAEQAITLWVNCSIGACLLVQYKACRARNNLVSRLQHWCVLTIAIRWPTGLVVSCVLLKQCMRVGASCVPLMQCCRFHSPVSWFQSGQRLTDQYSHWCSLVDFTPQTWFQSGQDLQTSGRIDYLTRWYSLVRDLRRVIMLTT